MLAVCRIFLSAVAVLFPIWSFAQGAGPTSAKTVEFSLVSFFSTKQLHRGAEIWPEASAFPGVGITLFEHWSIRGPNLAYQFFPERSSPIQLDLQLSYFDDNDPLISFGDHEEDYRNQRSPSLDSSITFNYKFGWRQLFSAGVTLSKEWMETHRYYSEFSLGAPLIPFVRLVGTASYAHKSTNQYLYGPEGVGGFGFYELSLRNAIPFVPWDGVILNQLSYSALFQQENRRGDFVRGADEHWVYRFLLIWNFYSL